MSLGSESWRDTVTPVCKKLERSSESSQSTGGKAGCRGRTVAGRDRGSSGGQGFCEARSGLGMGENTMVTWRGVPEDARLFDVWSEPTPKPTE